MGGAEPGAAVAPEPGCRPRGNRPGGRRRGRRVALRSTDTTEARTKDFPTRFRVGAGDVSVELDPHPKPTRDGDDPEIEFERADAAVVRERLEGLFDRHA